MSGSRGTYARALCATSALVVAGFGVIIAGWRGAARTIVVARQVPFLVSGSLTAVTLVGLGSLLFASVVHRRHVAHRRTVVASIVGDALHVLDHAASLAIRANRR